jgi:hypothetical protein
VKAHLDRANPNFDHQLAEDKRARIVIKAICKKCGASELVSVMDDSLTKWEDGHKCHTEKPSA